MMFVPFQSIYFVPFHHHFYFITFHIKTFDIKTVIQGLKDHWASRAIKANVTYNIYAIWSQVT